MSKTASLNRQIAALSLPAIASNITVPLLGLCDTAVSGHLGDERYLAAITAGGMMLNVVYWIFGFLRMGTTGLTAEAHGRDDAAAVSKVFSMAFSLALLSGIVIVLCRKPLLALLSVVIGLEPNSARLAADYYEICIWGAPALLGTLTIIGWFVGMQNTIWPMVTSITVNVVNVACSLLAVFALGMGFKGVACGTLVADWVGLTVALAVLVRFSKGRRLWCGFRALIHGGEVRKFFGVSNNLMLRSCCIMLVTLAVTAYGARLGDLTLAVNAVIMQYFLLFSYFMDGVAFSGEALCGKSYGATDRDGVAHAVKAISMWGVVAAIVFGAVYALFQPLVTGMLTDVEEVREGVSRMWVFVALIPPVSVAAFLADGFFIGMTATWRMLATTLAASALFFIIITMGVRDNITLFTAFLAYLFLRGAGLFAQLPHLINRIPKKN